MGDVFDEVQPQTVAPPAQQAQPAAAPETSPAPTPAPVSAPQAQGDVFEDAPKAPEPPQSQIDAMRAATTGSPTHVEQAWDWANKGLVDKDTLIAAAGGFSHLSGKVQGVNTPDIFSSADVDKALDIDETGIVKPYMSQGDTEGLEKLQATADEWYEKGKKDPKYAKMSHDLRMWVQDQRDTNAKRDAFLRQMVGGSMKDAAQNLSDFTSPMSVGMMALGPLAQVIGKGAQFAQVANFGKVAATLRGAKTVADISSLAASLGFGVEGAKQMIEGMPAAMRGDPEAVRQVFMGASMAASAVVHGGEATKAKLAQRRANGVENEAADAARVAKGRGTAYGERTLLAPTTATTAGVEAPISASQQPGGSKVADILGRLASPGAAKDFQKNKTQPAAQKQLVSSLGQVVEDAVNSHEAKMSDQPTPEAISGSQQPSQHQTMDAAADAARKSSSKTWQKADAVDAEAKSGYDERVRQAQAEVDEHNKLVDEHNANLGKDEAPMERIGPDEAASQVEKPVLFSELDSAVKKAQADTYSKDPAIRQQARDTDLPKAEKALDKWFNDHQDKVPPVEYQSAKRLKFLAERVQGIANKLRGPMATDTVNGNMLRRQEALYENRYGRGAFKQLLGKDGYQNWANVASILDPIKGPGKLEAYGERFGLGTFAAALAGLHLFPVGFAAKLGAEWMLNRAMFDPAWGQWFTKAFGHYRLTGTVTPQAKRDLNSLMRNIRLSDTELKTQGWSQDQIDKGEHLPGVGGGKPTAELTENVSDIADRYNEDEGRGRIRPVTPAVHPRGMDIAEAYDTMKHDPSNPEVKKAYSAMKSDIDKQWEHAEDNGFHFEPWTDEGQPYANSKEMREDVDNNRHLYFFQGGDLPEDHPLKQVDPKTGLTYNDKFRAVHDLFGHAAHGHEFGPKGEEGAYRTHAQMFSPDAIPALTSETRGQNNWVNYGPHMRDAEGNLLRKGDEGWKPATKRPYAENKAGLLPKEFHGDRDTAQDIAAAHNKGEGFTYNPEKGFVRNQKVFSVAMPDAPSHVFSTKNLTPSDVRDFMARSDVQRALKEDPRNSIGGWTYKGKAQLEVSKLIDSREEAIDEGKNLNQTAIYDHANRSDIPTGGTAGDDARSLQLHHWSNTGGLTETDPEFMGTGVRGAERARMNDEGFQKRTNFGTEGYREPAVQSGKFHYVVDVDPTRYYDVATDPDGLWEKGFHDGGATGAENAVRDAGYSGYRVRHEVASFERVPVRPYDDSVAVNASGESDQSLENINRVAAEKAKGVKTVRIRPGGEEVPVLPQDAVDAKANRGETIVKRYPDGHEEIQDQGQGARYLGPKLTPEPETPATADASEIPTRYPKGINRSTALNPDQHVDMNAMQMADEASPSRESAAGTRVMGYMEKMARTIAGYTGVNYSEEELANPKAVVSKFINHVASNLEWLYDQVPAGVRDKTKRWYDSANKVNAKFAEQYGVTPEQSAGVTAALSPQNPWDNNIGLAKTVMDIFRNHSTVEMTPDMEKRAIDIMKLNPDFRPLMKQIRGKSLSEIKLPDTDTNPDAAKAEAVLKGLWTRLYDEAHGSKVNDQYSPDGMITGPSPDKRSWIGLDHVAKAIRILENGSLEHINSVMGDGHKIRNFYNNIINPNSAKGHVTIDTHAVSAGQLSPFGPNDTEAAHNFGGSTKGIPKAPGSDRVGLKGAYPVYAEAYRRVSNKLGIKPRELQSITWEAIKSLMGDEKKTPELRSKVKDIWQQVQDGKLTPAEARDKIKEESGGFAKPYWMSEEEWESHQPEGNTDFVFGANAGGD